MGQSYCQGMNDELESYNVSPDIFAKEFVESYLEEQPPDFFSYLAFFYKRYVHTQGIFNGIMSDFHKGFTLEY